MTLKIPYGLRGDTLVDIRDIREDERGLKCNCVCPNCGEKLRACIGKIRQPYFAHDNADCNPNVARQTILHLLAKAIIEEEKRIMFPPFSVSFEETDLYASLSAEERRRPVCVPVPEPYINEQIMTVDEVYLEKRVSGIVPDIIVKKAGRICLIEIAVTHFVDEEKRKKVKELELPMIEINLGGFSEVPMNKEVLKDIMINNCRYTHWINNPHHYELAKKYTEKHYEKGIKDQKEREYQQRIEREKAEERSLWVKQKKTQALENIKHAWQPETYRRLIQSLRNDQEYCKYCKTYTISERFQNLFFLDIPIRGEFVFKCDHRIWQSEFFLKFIYNRKPNAHGSVFSIIEWNKHNSSKIPVNWDYWNRDVQERVILSFLGYMDRLGFIKLYEDYTFEVVARYNIDPPHRERAQRLRQALECMDKFSLEETEQLVKKFD